MDKHYVYRARVCTSIAIVRQRYFVNSSRPRANPARLVVFFFQSTGPDPDVDPRDPLPRDEDFGFVSPGNTATGRRPPRRAGSRVSQSSSSDVGRSVEPSGRVKRGRADVDVESSLWLSDPLSLSLSRRVGPGADDEEGIGNRIKSNQINQSARRRRRRVEESSRRREARGRVPDDRGARRGRRRRRIETKDTAV